MTIQYSAPVNNARLDSVESTVGASAKLKIYTGSVPATCATAPTGTLLLDIALPSDWMAAASASAKSKLGTWSGSGVAAGTAGYFRITDTAGTAVGMQGTVGLSAADMIVDNTNIAVSQVVTVSTFTLNAPL